MRRTLIIATVAACFTAAGCSDVGNFWDQNVVGSWNDNVRPLYAKVDELGPLATRSTDVGVVLTTPSGMTLYTYRDDPDGQSTCTGRCARSWPPVVADAGAKQTNKLSVVKRKDGTRQWAYEGRPLYTWHKDQSPGDTTGHNVGGSWHVARP
jgi:predicted lipoprotein with Yx(FWY)xxD motif